MKKTSTSEKLKLIFLMLYFVILTTERVISLVTVFTGDLSKYGALDWYMTVLTVCSIIGAYAYMLTKCRVEVTKYSNGKVSASPAQGDGLFGQLAIAAGILLLGGMVHTEGTILPIQFASYGMILVSMAIHTAVSVKQNGGGLIRWLSFGYIVAFSMAIPVVYAVEDPAKVMLPWLFVPLEVVVSAGMVVLFTVMLRGFYNTSGKYSFPVAPIIAAVIGDAAVLALRWNEKINEFVLIFISVSAVLFCVGKIVSAGKKG